MFCEVCHGIGEHRSGCPERTPQKVAYCDLCGDPIYEGDSIYDVDGVKSHVDCFAEKYEVKA